MNFKKLESGRSMVEMLGVLAIIGVLSVGGIAGYSLSMRRHRANQVVDLMAKYAVAAYSDAYHQVPDGYCPGCTLNFENTGVGTMPAGVDTNSVYSVYSGDTGTDIIIVSANFDDDKLCQAVASIVGTGCESNSSDKFVRFKFQQN